MLTAWEAGADAVKIFPCGNVGGAKYIKALKGPFPQIAMIPTGGVNLETAGDFLKAGACAIAVGGGDGGREDDQGRPLRHHRRARPPVSGLRRQSPRRNEVRGGRLGCKAAYGASSWSSELARFFLCALRSLRKNTRIPLFPHACFGFLSGNPSQHIDSSLSVVGQASACQSERSSDSSSQVSHPFPPRRRRGKELRAFLCDPSSLRWNSIWFGSGFAGLGSGLPQIKSHLAVIGLALCRA